MKRNVKRIYFTFLDSVCNVKNETDFYVPHEKKDGCRFYIRCIHKLPVGLVCNDDLCWDHNNHICGHCDNVICESEMNPTTQGMPEFLSTFGNNVKKF